LPAKALPLSRDLSHATLLLFAQRDSDAVLVGERCLS